MFRIDIVVSNDRHHWAMACPIAQSATNRGYSCRILSFCEFRGIVTPAESLGNGRIPVVKLSRIRRPRAVKGKGVGGGGKASSLVKDLAWYLALAANVRRAFSARPDLVILFNDAAYPYDRLCRLLRESKIPFMLIQEGIRYDVSDSAQEGALNQGKGGATAIAAWGESSAEYFRRQGASPETIHLTGNPRFDEIEERDLESKAHRIRKELELGSRTLLFLSNPVEFHGYCSIDQKLELVRDFIFGLEPLFEDEEFRLVFKLHSHEDPDDFRAAADASPHSSRIVIVSDYDLYPLLTLAEGAVIFSTTAGLEAVLFGVPLGVLELPGVGFLHDFVSEGAAVPLRWSEPMADQVGRLLASKGCHQPSVERYLDRTLALRRGATEKILDLVEELLSGRSMRPAPHAAQ